MSDMQPIEVSAVILFDGPRMLVNRRPEGSYFGGWWEWPGGKCLPGEGAEACARRELREEIGIEAGPLLLFDTIEADYPGRKVRVTFFVGRPTPGARAAPGALEHRWLPGAEVAGMQFLPPNVPVLERLIANPPQLD